MYNVLVLQSGGPTPVMNRSLYGVVAEASGAPGVGDILGARHGIEGLLKGNFADLRRPSKAAWRRIAASPAAALGTTRHSPDDKELQIALEQLKRINVRNVHIIGGNDSALTGDRLARAAERAGQDLNVVNIPKTIDNDLVLTDHTPGYASAARFVALATLGAGLDAEAMRGASPVTLIEVMGRDAGWLAASAMLVKRSEREAPHVLGLPEIPLDEERFLGLIEDAYSRHGFAVAVIAERVLGTNGRVLGSGETPEWVDSFGHEYHKSPVRYLAQKIVRRLGVRVRDEKPGTIQRSFSAANSAVDENEAEEAGRAAVRYALAGYSRAMVTLIRESDKPYRSTTGRESLEVISGAVRVLPDEFLDRERSLVNAEYVKYASPIVGRLQRPSDRL